MSTNCEANVKRERNLNHVRSHQRTLNTLPDTQFEWVPLVFGILRFPFTRTPCHATNTTRSRVLPMPTCGAMWLFINLIVITNYYACPIGRTTSACCPISIERESSSTIRQHVSTILSMKHMDQSTFSERRMNNQNNSFLISKYMYGINRIAYLFPKQLS